MINVNQIDSRLSTPYIYEPSQKEELCPFVYGLVDPLEPKHVRYVGMAFKAQRPYQHAINARRETKHSYLFHWIRGLQAVGREPTVLILEELMRDARRSFVGEIEKMYISSLRKIGHRLTNVAKGGDGGDTGNYVHSKESRVATVEALRKYYADAGNRAVIAERNARQSKTKLDQWAKYPEMRHRLSQVMTGKQSRLGAVLSEEAKKSLSAGMRRYYNDPNNKDEVAERNAKRARTKAGRPKIVMSTESNEARSRANTGRIVSKATRSLLSAAAKEREQRKRESKND